MVMGPIGAKTDVQILALEHLGQELLLQLIVHPLSRPGTWGLHNV